MSRFFRPAFFLTTALLAACGTEATAPVRPAAAAPVARDGSLMTPGRPQLATVPDHVAAGTRQTVVWNMWWGENGRRWVVYLNGAKAAEGVLEVNSPKAQQASAEVELVRAGRNEIRVDLCNDLGCSPGEPVYVLVGA